MTTSSSTPVLRFVTGCACALLIAGGAALAHGHNNHNSGGHQDNQRSMNSSGHGGDWGGDHGWHHQPHHRKYKSAGTGPGGLGPVHGPGSSHNPIVTKTQPVVRDHRNGSSNGGRPYDRSCLTVVGGPLNGSCIRGASHHHRPPRFNPRCNKRVTVGCKVRDHRTPPPTQCYGDLC